MLGVVVICFGFLILLIEMQVLGCVILWFVVLCCVMCMDVIIVVDFVNLFFVEFG